jgi:hypothetical protein
MLSHSSEAGLQATIAGSIILAQAFLNRETRDGLSPSEQSYLNDSFRYTGGGLVLTALAARSFFKSGFALRVMSANPCTALHTPVIRYNYLSIKRIGLVLGVGLAGSIGSMMGVFYTPPEKSFQKHMFWVVSAGMTIFITRFRISS